MKTVINRFLVCLVVMELFDFKGNVNIGLMAFVNDKIALVGRDVSPVEKIKDVLGVEVIRATVGGTNLIGLFVTGDNKRIVVSDIISEDELNSLTECGLKVDVLQTRFTALGNNVIIGKKVFCNAEMEESAVNKLKGERLLIDNDGIISSFISFNSKKGIISPYATAGIIDLLEKSEDIELGVGTVNFGSFHVKSGMLINNTGLLVGSSTSGPELMRLKEIFG